MEEQAIELPELPPKGWLSNHWSEQAVVAYTGKEMQAYARAAVLADRQRILSSEVVQFLYGAGDLDGVGFSEVPEGKPRYWWRSILRAAIRGNG
jgi:hypothetical protein